MPDSRLIERWLPIAALGIESTRERTPMTPFPVPNRLPVWWVRPPLVASQAAMLASLPPTDADGKELLHALAVHGDPLAAGIEAAGRKETAYRLGMAMHRKNPRRLLKALRIRFTEARTKEPRS